jgi:hypothetical protein
MNNAAAELIPIESPGQLVEFGGFQSPEQFMKRAQEVATEFQKHARRLQLYKRIGESEHLLLEGWQMLGAMYRVTASITCTNHVQYGDAQGWEATAEAIFVPTGMKISSADAMCMDDEDKWGMVSKYEYIDNKKTKVGDVAKPMQQLRSMAQTRAESKVLSNLLKWVARMAGFSATPAEEMAGEDRRSPKAPQQSTTAGNRITEQQKKRLWAIGMDRGLDKERIIAIIKHFGFESSEAITRDKYDVIVAELEKPEGSE